MSQPNNLEWLDKVIDELYTYAYQSGEKFMTGLFKKNVKANAKLAITAKINEIEQEAYRSGYVAGGVEILNASCEICHAYPMTADCNNANCHAIEI